MDKQEPVAWMYERKPDACPPASSVITQERWADDAGARPFWTETPLYTPATIAENEQNENACANCDDVPPYPLDDSGLCEMCQDEFGG